MACFGSWPVITRAGTFALDLPIIVFMRFVVPIVFFLPAIFRLGLVPRGVSPTVLLIMVIGSGFPFFLCAAAALALAPVAEVGPLMPGTPPLLVALWMLLFERQSFRRVQVAGLVLITLGVATIVGFRMFQSHAILIGHGFAIAAAVLWSAYTIAFRASGLTSVESAAVVSAWSVVFAFPFGALFVYDAVTLKLYSELGAQFVMQGLGTGVVAIFLFGITIRNLGPSEASAMVALGPVLSVALAIPLLGEWPEASAIVGLVAITAGVVLANWRPPRQVTPPLEDDDIVVQRLDPSRWRRQAN